MLTPRFSLDQAEDFLTVRIFAPFTNVADTEVFFDELDFRFYSRPYFLRLHLPAPVEETDEAQAHYDADTKSFVVQVPKKVKGQHFQGLDMITDLLLPKGDTALSDRPLVEELGQEDCEVDCYFDQQLPKELTDEQASAVPITHGYGFACKRTGVFSRLLDECQHVFEIQGLDGKSFKDRRREREENESKCFSPDHYLADLHDPPDTLTGCLLLDQAPLPVHVKLDQADRERMVELSKKKKRVSLSPTEHLSVCYGMLDVLYAYCYEARVGMFDPPETVLGPESAWTVAKLASSLSCGERFTHMRQVVVATLRRTMCYPLHRNFRLGIKVWNDVSSHLLSQESVVKVFLQLIPQFIDDNYGHLFNQLYIEDYAVWCQSLKPGTLIDLQNALQVVLQRVTKGDLDLELEELELAAKLTLDEVEQQSKESVVEKLKDLNLSKSPDSDDSDTEDSESDSSDSDESGESSSDDSESDDAAGTNDSKFKNDTETKRENGNELNKSTDYLKRDACDEI